MPVSREGHNSSRQSPRGETGTLGIEVGEGGHHIAAAGQPHQPVFPGHPHQLARLFPQPVVGQGLDGPDRLQLVGGSDVFIEADGGKRLGMMR